MYMRKYNRSGQLLSNFHDPTIVWNVHSGERNCQVMNVTSSQANTDYNANMLYVYRIDYPIKIHNLSISFVTDQDKLDTKTSLKLRGNWNILPITFMSTFPN